ncbi:MAG TPA: FISUMP domain-containing protein [Prolixibacteraceae bacterium]|nr:FISUMP domain-containing protein [Prolixibacteraceae bacterium]
MRKIITILPFMLVLMSGLIAQDIIYTFSGDLEKANTPLESILIENLNNGTSLFFGELPVQPNYQVNLTKKQLWGSTGLNDLLFSETAFVIEQNTPGLFAFSLNSSLPGNTEISVCNVNGQIVTSAVYPNVSKGSLLSIAIEQDGIFLIAVKSGNSSMSFKMIGKRGNGNFEITLSQNQNKGTGSLKSKTLITANDDFFFSKGDNLKLTVFKLDFFSDPKTVTLSGSEKFVFTFETATGKLADERDGNIYNTLRIGTQRWMIDNLAYLPAVSPSADGSSTDPHYYVYGYQGSNPDSAKIGENYNKYGVLYNWQAAINGVASSSANPSGVQGACPAGWHLPSNAEWGELIDFLIESGYSYNFEPGENNVGKAMAAKTTWKNSPSVGTPGHDVQNNNRSGFNAVASGRRVTPSGVFDNMSSGCFWWSSTESETLAVWYRSLYFTNTNIDSHYASKEYGMSVRCIRD